MVAKLHNRLARARSAAIFLSVLLGFLFTLGQPAVVQAGMLLASGSYTGDGVNNSSITGLGFQPDVVIIKGNNAQPASTRTSTMTGDASKQLSSNPALATNRIQSLDADGFTHGRDAAVNSNSDNYYYVAFKAAAGELAVGSYTGNGSDNRSITGVGLQSNYVIVMSSGRDAVVHRFASQTGDATLLFNGSAEISDRIQAFETDGFQVGANTEVNKNGETYHYLAWKEASATIKVGAYAGGAADNRKHHRAGLSTRICHHHCFR